jgi:hypothetical protein
VSTLPQILLNKNEDISTFSYSTTSKTRIISKQVVHGKLFKDTTLVYAIYVCVHILVKIIGLKHKNSEEHIILFTYN